MIHRLGAAIVLLVFALSGCTVFVLESQTTHFAASEYTYPLADGTYAIAGDSRTWVTLARMADHVAVTMIDDNGKPNILIGGFIALATPGYFILQVTDGSQDGQPADKKSGEATYVPMHLAASGEVTWFVGPTRCDQDCTDLLAAHGFRLEGRYGWQAPKTLTRSQLTAFYEALAPVLERSPDAWETLRMLHISGT